MYNQIIKDTDNISREVAYIKKIKHMYKDLKGQEILEDFIEVLILGKERKWVQYYPLIEFMRLNPEVRI
jgi:hypothetical protein